MENNKVVLISAAVAAVLFVAGEANAAYVSENARTQFVAAVKSLNELPSANEIQKEQFIETVSKALSLKEESLSQEKHIYNSKHPKLLIASGDRSW